MSILYIRDQSLNQEHVQILGLTKVFESDAVLETNSIKVVTAEVEDRRRQTN
jgi:hypothetical protein